MKILNRYIRSTLLSAIFLVLLIITGLQVFIVFISQLEDIGSGNYSIGNALKYVMYTLPSGIYDFFPMIGLIGSLTGLGYLASHSELMVMQTSGVSRWRVLWAVLRAAIICLFVMTLMGEWLGPKAWVTAESEKNIAISGSAETSSANTEGGIWLNEGNRFIHIGSMIPGVHLTDITEYEIDSKHQLKAARHATEATYLKGSWQLKNIVETRFIGEKVTSQQIPQENWKIKINPKVFNTTEENAEAMSLKQLQRLIHFRQLNGLSASTYQLIFWKRVFQPIATLVMILLSIPFIFGPLRTVTMGIRIVFGVAVGFLFYLLNQFFGPIILYYQYPPILGAALPSLLFLVIGTAFMRYKS